MYVAQVLVVDVYSRLHESEKAYPHTHTAATVPSVSQHLYIVPRISATISMYGAPSCWPIKSLQTTCSNLDYGVATSKYRNLDFEYVAMT